MNQKPPVTLPGQSTITARGHPVAVRPLWNVLVHGFVLLATVSLLVTLLIRYPFDGLSGQDSYAYYYQALEVRNHLTMQAGPAWPFAGEGLHHWPVGYHLYMIAGLLLAGEGPAGGRAITLLMAVLTPLLIYAVTSRLLRGAYAPVSTLGEACTWMLGGTVSAGVLLSSGIFVRTGLALMSDVPALFWSVACVYASLRAWGPPEMAGRRPGGWRWPAAAGATLGMAVLLRYGSVLLLAPVAVLFMIERLRHPRRLTVGRPSLRSLLVAGIAFLLAVSPQLVYAVTQGDASVDAGWLAGWSPERFFSSTISPTPDGTLTYGHPMWAFYLLEPLGSTTSGFLSPLYIPALLLGIALLVSRRRWSELGLLLTWWLVPVLFFSGTPYQAQRFVLAYLPSLAVFIGVGAAQAAEIARQAWLIRKVAPRHLEEQASQHRAPDEGTGGLKQRSARRAGSASVLRSALSVGVLVGVLLAGYQGLGAGRQLVAGQAAEKAGELRLVAELKRAVGSSAGEPHIVSFGLSAAIYHYTQWQVLDFYNHGQNEIEPFLAQSSVGMLVLPEERMRTQWVDTPSSARWEWMRRHYVLERLASVGEYSIYRFAGSRSGASR